MKYFLKKNYFDVKIYARNGCCSNQLNTCLTLNATKCCFFFALKKTSKFHGKEMCVIQFEIHPNAIIVNEMKTFVTHVGTNSTTNFT